MNYEEYKEDFDRNGYVVVRQFLPSDEMADLRENLDRYIREIVPTLSGEDAFYQNRDRPETLKQLHNMAQDSYFAEYRANVRWLTLAETLLGEPVEALQEPEWFNKPPGTAHPTPPHQDNYYFCLQPPSVITMWIALDSVDENNGCLRYVSGSHRDGLRSHQASDVLGFSQGIADYGPDDESREVAVRLEPGDLTVHHGETIHRADPNRTENRSRRSFAMVINSKSCCRDEGRYAEYLAAMKAQHEAKGLKSP